MDYIYKRQILIHQEAVHAAQEKPVSHLLITGIFLVSILIAKENGEETKKKKVHIKGNGKKNLRLGV